MGKPRGFLEVKREVAEYRPVCERVKDYKDVSKPRPDGMSRDQASRCMDCGTPFCHWGCPIGNYIPEWNDLVCNDQWERAFELLDASNPMPEITGRICPAICEFACVLGINDEPVTIRENELAIIEHAFKKGWVVPRPPKIRTGKKVAVVGSGPAGLACAAQLNKLGHSVTVFERDDRIGGILRYGIPDFKLEKKILDRRIEIWEKEGIKFRTGVEAGKQVVGEFDAVCLATGCRTPRDLKILGRELEGVHLAMDYLVQANKKTGSIDAKGKRAVVIGGGDTGSDCVGTANRQGAKCVVQIELLPQPPECRDGSCPWPTYPLLLKTTSSHEEGAERHWSVLTKKFKGQGSRVQGLECVKIKFEGGKMIEVPGSEFEIEADLVILAIGFIKEETGEEWQDKKVFKAGDVQRGPSLVVWAIWEGREAARSIDAALTRG
jgi:glutamate synthase (NADPH/NADH) small chain